MVEKDRFLVVVSVFEGRKFPKRARHQLIAEARFDGELLATDAAEHTENPDFTQELGWELDKKALHQHRLQRTSIKIQFYAIDVQSTMKEQVGYVVMDLRSAQTQQTSKWHTLLHSKYHKSKPEVRLSIYIDDDKNAPAAGFKAKEAPARQGQELVGGAADCDFEPRLIRPVLNQSEGFYQIGPPERCHESFALSVTVSFASNLPQLIPTNIALPPTGYFFYYSLLGNDVTNEVFHDLLNPNFAPEMATVRMRSSYEALLQFFHSQPGIEMHLCCGEQSLGSCEIPLNTLLKKGSTEIYMKPVTFECAFQLLPPNRLKEQIPILPNDMKPTVGVAIMLKKESQTTESPLMKNKDDVPEVTEEPKQSSSEAPKKKAGSKASPKAKQQAQPQKKVKAGKKQARAPSPPTPHDGSYTETFESGSKTADQLSSLGQDHLPDKPTVAGKREKPETKEPPHDLSPGGIAGKQSHVERDDHTRKDNSNIPVMTLEQRHADEPESSSTQFHLAVPPQAHHITFSVDLRSIRQLDIEHHANIFLRYTYPFFGSAAPVATHPPVEVRRGMEVLLPQGFCTFNFAASIQQLQDTFNSLPLMIEVWDRDRDKQLTTLLGAARLPLSVVLNIEKVKAVNSQGVSGSRQVWNDTIPIVAAEGHPKTIGELLVVLSLEDWGPLATQKVVTSGDNTSQGISESEASRPVPKKVPEPRETLEYKAAIELELWKEQQETIFENQLKQRESQHMMAIKEELKRREKERELVTQKKISEYRKMEEELRKGLTSVTKREKELAAKEHEVLRWKKELEQEKERKMTEMREASRRMKEDCDHQVQLEKNKVREVEEYVTRLKQQMSEQEAKYQQLNKEFISFREQQNSRPEVRLQSEINLLTLEKVELERKLDSVTKSKVHYKQQWGRALKELARLKQREQTVARAQLKQQQQELEHMRMRYLAAEEKEVVQSEKKELQEIKNELSHLREQETSRQLSTEASMKDSQVSQAQEDDEEDEQITRLIEERDSLLRTGVYTTEDHIIAELDRQIREAIARKGSVLVRRKMEKNFQWQQT